ncbi:MAG: group II intron reverse transcriptase/maturase [Bacillota bacterium]|nr:group II intron reverse transcriptase/maturase [Bacillota bacterium]
MNVTKSQNNSRKHCDNSGWPQKDSAEHEGYAGALTDSGIAENNITNADRLKGGLLEEILAPSNLNQAYKRVKKNKGAGGVDGMSVEDLLQYLKGNGEEIRQTIRDGKYRPQPVLRVEIPKEDGKKRKLGIPTAVDRVIQQAIAQVLTPIYEPQFSDNSYGFRPRRSTHGAIKACQENIRDGYKYVVDMDLEKFFDTVNQSKLIEILSRSIKDGRVISLIHKYLRAGVVTRIGKLEETELGVPQGGPLSPLCGNILLNELDWELERRGHRFVRYADDMLIFCKSKRAARRTLENLTPYIERKLFLKVNREKTEVAYVGKVRFLGYAFYINKNKDVGLRVHPKSASKMKAKIRQITSRSNGMGYEIRKLKLKQFITGWVNYFKLADMKSLLTKTDQWLRRRIRMVIWKQWKRIRTRYAMLKKLGIIVDWVAWEGANIRKGYWRCARNPIIAKAISAERLKKAGYLNFLEYYESVRA